MTNRIDASRSEAEVERRIAAHRRERVRARRWVLAFRLGSFAIAATYVWLLIGVRVLDPFYLVVNVLAIATGAGGYFVHKAREVPPLLEQLRSPDPAIHETAIAAAERLRTELVPTLVSLELARDADEAATVAWPTVAERLAATARPDWPARARIYVGIWALLLVGIGWGVLAYRPEYGVTLPERLAGKRPPGSQWKG